MNRKQSKIASEEFSEKPARRGTMHGLSDKPTDYDIGPDEDPFDWVHEVIAALGRYLFAGELTAPMTHRPKMVVHDDGAKSVLVRYLRQEKPQTLCIGPPLSPEQAEEARGFFTHPETNVQKR